MFLSEKTAQSNFLENVNVPFDAVFLTAKIGNNKNHVEITESYRVSMSHPIRVSNYGKWSVELGLKTTHSSYLYYRRNDLEGIKFNVGSLEVSNII